MNNDWFDLLTEMSNVINLIRKQNAIVKYYIYRDAFTINRRFLIMRMYLQFFFIFRRDLHNF